MFIIIIIIIVIINIFFCVIGAFLYRDNFDETLFIKYLYST